MAGKIIHYYACGNTAKGFVNHFDSNLKGLDKIYILKGGPGTGKSTLMKTVGDFFNNKNYNIELVHCSSDNESIDGVIIPYLKAAVVDGTAPHVLEPTAPGAIEEYVNLGEAWDSAQLRAHKDTIVDLKTNITKCYENAYDNFAKGMAVHNDWEKVYIDNMNFNKANRLTDEIINKVLEGKKADKKPMVKERFMGAITPNGPVNYVENLTEGIGRRFFIKGRPGSGKSTMLKKLAAAAQESGYDTEIYYCSFDPDSLDMVIIRELDVCVFDATAPHEYYPSRDGDELIDMYELLINSGTDERNAVKLTRITRNYKEAFEEGMKHLVLAKKLHDDLEKIYVPTMDFAKIERITNELIFEINILNKL